MVFLAGRRAPLLAVAGVCVFCMIAGCIGTGPPGTPPQPAASPTLRDEPVLQVPVSSGTPASPEATTVPAATAAPAPVPVQPAETQPVAEATRYVMSMSDPLPSDVTIKKGYFETQISDCIMREAYPVYAKDPAYGVGPGIQPKIAALSPQEMNVFTRDWMEGKNERAKTIGFTGCEGAPLDPSWNFVKISGRFIPRNAKISDYEVTLVVKGLGKDLGIIKSTVTLTLEQPVGFESYIPLKVNQMEYIDNVEIQFKRLTNR